MTWPPNPNPPESRVQEDDFRAGGAKDQVAAGLGLVRAMENAPDLFVAMLKDMIDDDMTDRVPDSTTGKHVTNFTE